MGRKTKGDEQLGRFFQLTLGGITGIAASAITISDKRTKYAMGGGAALCAVFAGLLLRGSTILRGVK